MKDEIKEMNFSEMLFNKDERLLDYITNLQEENEKVHKELDYADNYNIYLISKIDKAIEYIDKELKDLYKSNHQCKHLMEITYLENIKEILQGEEND